MINDKKTIPPTPTSKDGIWVDLHSDLVAGIKAFGHCISFADVMYDNDYRLICADVNCNLKVFKGNILQNEAKLQFNPVAICSFYAPDSNAKNCIPYLAVAGCNYIFIYRNLKGTFKFCIPNIDPNPAEVQIWTDLKDGKLEHQAAIAKLIDLTKANTELSVRSCELLDIKDQALRIQFIEKRKFNPIVISNYVVCMISLRKNNAELPNATSNLVVGTEGGIVYVIDHSGSKIIAKYKIPSSPFQIVAVGAFDVEYRLFIAARNNIIYSIKNGEAVQSLIDVTQHIVAMLRTEKSLIVGTMNSYMHSYNTNGRKIFSLSLPACIVAMELFEIKRTGGLFKPVLVALKNNELRMYNEKVLINSYKTTDIIFGLKTGRFGTEDDCLVMLTESGALLVKALSKSVNIENISYTIPKKPLDEIGLNVPKKTKLYLDLIEREKEVASHMNSVFQSDLVKLKYKTMDTYVKMLKIGNAPQNYSSTSTVKLSASLQGLGPNFKLNLIVDNSGNEPVHSADLILDYDKSVFAFEKENIQLGVIMPKVPVKYNLCFRNNSETGSSGMIKIVIVDKSRTTPLVQSTIKVPISELDIL